MSRRLGGRFGANTSEAYQRQLTAPVHKWKRAWVAPTGLQPESSYKICKWVRVDTAEADDGTPLPDEDEEMDEGEEGDEGEGEDGQDVVEGDAAEGEAGAETAAEVIPVDETAKEVDAAPAESAAATESAVVAEDTTVPSLSTDPAPAAPAQPAASPLAPAVPVETVPAAVPSAVSPAHHDLPPNAIEITNTAPGSTELGHGDLGADGGVEITHGEPHDLPTEVKGVEGDGREEAGMAVDQPASTTAVAEAGGAGGAEGGTAPEVDSGLVMGDLETERKEFEIQGEDKPREMEDSEQ